MKHLARIVRVHKRDVAINSDEEMLAYWLSQSPTERIAAALNLRRSAYKLINGRDLPHMTKVVRVMKRNRS